MKDGFINRWIPQNNYDYPSNQFVASFISTPQMNFFDVTLKREDGKVWAVFGTTRSGPRRS